MSASEEDEMARGTVMTWNKMVVPVEVVSAVKKIQRLLDQGIITFQHSFDELLPYYSKLAA